MKYLVTALIVIIMVLIAAIILQATIPHATPKAQMPIDYSVQQLDRNPTLYLGVLQNRNTGKQMYILYIYGGGIMQVDPSFFEGSE